MDEISSYIMFATRNIYLKWGLRYLRTEDVLFCFMKLITKKILVNVIIFYYNRIICPNKIFYILNLKP